MENYNYFEAVKNDVRDRLGDYDPRGEDETLEEYQERLHDALWIDDSVTGNGSGSYTFNTAKAKEFVLAGIEQVLEACQEFGESLGELIEAGEWERLDVITRCYYLSQAIGEVVTEQKHNYN